jgi:hypothetical protein
MTDAQVNAVINSAAAMGRTVDPLIASIDLSAKEYVAANNSEYLEASRDVIAAFSRFLIHGEAIKSFSLFLLPIPETDEEIVYSEKLRSEHLAYLETHGR